MFLIELFRGMGITLKHFFGKTITIQYPEQRRVLYDRTRWRHILRRHENGLEKCIGCSLCAGSCPVHCIRVVAAENTDADRHSPGERYAKTYEINILRCIFCGYCQDACPTGAIVLRKDFELARDHRSKFLYTKEMLLEPWSPPQPAPAPASQPAEMASSMHG